MEDVIKKRFLGARLKELREKNEVFTMEEMAKRINAFDDIQNGGINKSSISRAENGNVGEKTIIAMAEKYCAVFGLTKKQMEQFFRVKRIAVPDTSALLRNTQLIDQLNREYSKVVIAKVVIDELDRIKNNFGNTYTVGNSRRAREILKGISYGDRTISMDYTGDNRDEIDDYKIICIAQEASELYQCGVDIITEDTDYSAYLKGREGVVALYLREYIATKQGIVNMDRYKRIRDYYADSYDDIEVPSEEEINAYDDQGYTLLISCVRNYNIPVNQRKAKIKWLLTNGADINRRDCERRYFPALSHAIQMKNRKDGYEMFTFLLDECDADPNAGSRNPHGIGNVRQKNEGNMPLMIAAWHGKDEFVGKLCEHDKISINQQDENGFTALIKACANGHTRCRDILIKAGADTKIIDINGKNFEDHYDDFLDYGPLATRNQNGKNNAKKKWSK